MKRLILCLTVLSIISVLEAKPRVFLYGDASVANSLDSLTGGWGEVLADYMAEKVLLQNNAQPATSLKMFIDNDGVKQISDLPSKSVVILQFGNNDLNELNKNHYSTLDDFIRQMDELMKAALKNKLHVVLCTPLACPYYFEGRLIDRLGGYDDAVRRVAEYYKVSLIDLQNLTHNWLLSIPEEQVQMYFAEADENNAILLTKDGASEVAKMVRDAMLKDKKLAKLIRK